MALKSRKDKRRGLSPGLSSAMLLLLILCACFPKVEAYCSGRTLLHRRRSHLHREPSVAGSTAWSSTIDETTVASTAFAAAAGSPRCPSRTRRAASSFGLRLRHGDAFSLQAVPASNDNDNNDNDIPPEMNESENNMEDDKGVVSNEDFALNDMNDSAESQSEMRDLLRSLQDRQAQVLQGEERKARQLRKAACTSGVSLVLPDWVRRLDVDYPLIVCGSASDILYLAHLETHQVLASTAVAMATAAVVPNLKITEARVEHVVNQLYGRFDGGGTLAVSMRGSLVVESRRSGGVYVWRINTSSSSSSSTTSSTAAAASKATSDDESDSSTPTTTVSLVSQGFIPSLQDCIVTALKLQDDYLWVGTDDGSVEAYSLDESQLPLTLRTQPDLSWKVGGSSGSSSTRGSSSRVIVMSLDICPKLGCVVAATDSGSIELLSFEDDNDDDERAMIRKPIGSYTPQFDGTERRSYNVYPTCATFVASSNQSMPSYSIACGANDGSIFVHPLYLDSDGEIDMERPFHLAPPVAKTVAAPAAADGSLTASSTALPLPPTPRVRQLMPQHFATVKCMASPAPGLLLTGGLDGTLRLWDTDVKKFLYQFVGYKVWLGSLYTDGERIVTDGADNTIIMHDFSASATASKDEKKGRGDSNSRKPDQAEDTDV